MSIPVRILALNSSKRGEQNRVWLFFRFFLYFLEALNSTQLLRQYFFKVFKSRQTRKTTSVKKLILIDIATHKIVDILQVH